MFFIVAKRKDVVVFTDEATHMFVNNVSISEDRAQMFRSMSDANDVANRLGPTYKVYTVNLG